MDSNTKGLYMELIAYVRAKADAGDEEAKGSIERYTKRVEQRKEMQKQLRHG